MVSTTSLRQLGFKAPRFRVSPDWAKSGDVNKVHWWPNILKLSIPLKIDLVHK